MSYTPEQQDAARNPRVGDVWEKGHWRRLVVHATERRVYYAARFWVRRSCAVQCWLKWCAGATLLRRGEVDPLRDATKEIRKEGE